MDACTSHPSKFLSKYFERHGCSCWTRPSDGDIGCIFAGDVYTTSSNFVFMDGEAGTTDAAKDTVGATTSAGRSSVYCCDVHDATAAVGEPSVLLVVVLRYLQIFLWLVLVDHPDPR
jgi:hypothetical protein